MTCGLPGGETASARVPASPFPCMSSPIPQGPTFFQSPVVPADAQARVCRSEDRRTKTQTVARKEERGKAGSLIVPFAGHGGSGGGAGGTTCAVAWPETLPGDLTTVELVCLNQQRPLDSV